MPRVFTQLGLRFAAKCCHETTGLARPDVSNRTIAADLGVSPTTVGSVRDDLVATVQIEQLDKTVGKDGKQLPAIYWKLHF